MDARVDAAMLEYALEEFQYHLNICIIHGAHIKNLQGKLEVFLYMYQVISLL
jgi:hypothetical protein